MQIGFKGYGLSPEKVKTEVNFEYEGGKYTLKHGSVVIAAITSCTNTSNPSVMLGAGQYTTFKLKFFFFVIIFYKINKIFTFISIYRSLG